MIWIVLDDLTGGDRLPNLAKVIISSSISSRAWSVIRMARAAAWACISASIASTPIRSISLTLFSTLFPLHSTIVNGEP